MTTTRKRAPAPEPPPPAEPVTVHAYGYECHCGFFVWARTPEAAQRALQAHVDYRADRPRDATEGDAR